jgi:hypothetical protein
MLQVLVSKNSAFCREFDHLPMVTAAACSDKLISNVNLLAFAERQSLWQWVGWSNHSGFVEV